MLDLSVKRSKLIFRFVPYFYLNTNIINYKVLPSVLLIPLAKWHHNNVHIGLEHCRLRDMRYFYGYFYKMKIFFPITVHI